VFGAGRPDKQPADDRSQGSGGSAGPAAPARGRIALSGRTVGVAAAAVAVAIGGGAYTLASHSGDTPERAEAATAQLPSGPIRFESMTPASGTTQADGAAPIVLTFSQPVAPNTPRPTLKPAVAGSWSTAGNQLIFTPSAALAPSTRETVSVPAGVSGVRGEGGGLLTTAVSDQFRTASYSTLRLAQVLAQLGYMPMTWAESGNAASSAQSSLAGTQEALAYQPPAGTFTWEPGYPSDLHQLWTANGNNVILRGAVYAFQSEHNMTLNGNVTPRLWQKVFHAASENLQNSNGYTYAVASKAAPETLTIWHDGHRVFRSLANTGIPVSPTVDGSFPVYQKYTFQIMSGTNPDGSHYADPVSFVSYFNGGDAVHYFPRGSYGFQQSLGCVELPYDSAEQAYPYLTYGSIVTVTG
jgi:Bacterial Ig-like domain/L,D-transpeptidase catalytic domain